MKQVLIFLTMWMLLTACENPFSEEDSKDVQDYKNHNVTFEEEMIPDKLLTQGKDSLAELITFTTYYKYSVSIADSLQIVERVDEGNTTVATYKFEHESKPYYGAYVAWRENNKWYFISSFEDRRISSLPAQNVSAGGGRSIPIHPEQKVFYDIHFGYVNDKDINRVNLQYTNQREKNIELDDQKDLYLDYSLNDDYVMRKITMLNHSGKVIWKREWKS